MEAKRLVIGTLMGGAAVVATGYLMFTIAFGDFYAYAMNSGSATGVQREPPLLWAVALGALSYQQRGEPDEHRRRPITRAGAGGNRGRVIAAVLARLR